MLTPRYRKRVAEIARRAGVRIIDATFAGSGHIRLTVAEIPDCPVYCSASPSDRHAANEAARTIRRLLRVKG